MKKILKALKVNSIIYFILEKLSQIIALFDKANSLIIPEELKIRKKTLLDKKIEALVAEETFEHFKEHFKKSVIFRDISREKIREYAIEKSLEVDDKNSNKFYYLEFGVAGGGSSSNFFSKYVNKLFAFDSFEGLIEDWVGTSLPKGYYNQNKKIPKLNSNVEPIVGWAEETIGSFIETHNPKINFIHFDMDTYKSTKLVLEKTKPFLVKNAILIFDNIYNYAGWENGEFKALYEVFKENEFDFKAFNLLGKQIVIQLK
mgnify:CR=1 FL=1